MKVYEFGCDCVSTVDVLRLWVHINVNRSCIAQEIIGLWRVSVSTRHAQPSNPFLHEKIPNSNEKHRDKKRKIPDEKTKEKSLEKFPYVWYVEASAGHVRGEDQIVDVGLELAW